MDKKSKPNHQLAKQVRETPMTFEDYAKLPDDGHQYELVGGKLELMSPTPTRTHQIISSQLLYLLRLDCQSEYEIVVSPIDVVLSATNVRQPDLVMIHLSRLSIYKERGSIEEPPDLVVEILSPSSRKRDKIDKRIAYARFGVREYWIINPDDNTLEQHLLGPTHSYDLVDVYAGDEPIHSEKLTCISFSMNDVMSRARILPDA